MSGAPPPRRFAWRSMLTGCAPSARVSRQALLTNNVRLKSAKNLYLRHRFFNEIRQIHRFFCNFRQKLQILCRNQARESWGKSRRKLEQSRRIYEPEMHVKSEQKYSDKARKTGKSLRHGEKIRQITQTWCTFQAAANAPQLHAPRAHGFLARQTKKRPDRSLTSPVSNVGWTYLRVTVAPASSS